MEGDIGMREGGDIGMEGGGYRDEVGDKRVEGRGDIGWEGGGGEERMKQGNQKRTNETKPNTEPTSSNVHIQPPPPPLRRPFPPPSALPTQISFFSRPPDLVFFAPRIRARIVQPEK